MKARRLIEKYKLGDRNVNAIVAGSQKVWTCKLQLTHLGQGFRNITSQHSQLHG